MISSLSSLPLSARLITLFVAGSLSAFAQQPYNLFPLMVVGFSCLWIMLQSFTRARHAYAGGFLFGLGYFLTGLWWIGNALLVDGNPYIWAMPLAVLGLQTFLSFYTALGIGIARHLAPRTDTHAFLLFIGVVSASEWLRGHAFTGFPWNSFGTIWADFLPMAQISSLVGMYGLTLLTIFICALPGFLLTVSDKKIKTSFAFAGLILITVWLGFGAYRLSTHPQKLHEDIILQVISPNIPQGEKWDSNLLVQNFLKTTRMIAARDDQQDPDKTRLIILPETAFHHVVMTDPAALEVIQKSINAHPQKTYLLTGALRKTVSEDKPTYHNSLVVMDQTGSTRATFDKFHLVPFGEYIPFQDYIPLKPIVEFSGFKAGNGPQTLHVDSIPPFSPLVCYEVIFPGNVTADKNARWMVNVTNDAWYGFSPGPYQHLAQTRLRAIEEGIPLIRSANTGISAVIDPLGRYVAQGPLFEDNILVTPLPQALESPTAYGRFGDTFFAAFVLFLLILGLKRKDRSR
jgi:apolipoprotein N-acyltransferase